MEYERSLFRIYEKMTENRQHWSRPMLACSRMCLMISFTFFASLIILQMGVGKGNKCIHRAFEKYLDQHMSSVYPPRSEALALGNFTVNGELIVDPVFYVMGDNDGPPGRLLDGQGEDNKPYLGDVPLQNRSSLYMKGDIVNFYFVDIGSAHKNSSDYPYIKPQALRVDQLQASVMAVSEELLVLRQMRRGYSWYSVNHTVPVDASCFSDTWYSYLYFGEGKETLYILDILNTFKQVKDRLAIYSFEGKEYWEWSAWELSKMQGLFSLSLQSKIYEVVYLSLGLVIVSFAASLYTKVVSMLSPLILYAILKCCGRRLVEREGRQADALMNEYYRAFTWIGMYLKTIQRNRGAAKFESFFILSIFLTLFFFYYTYICLAHLTVKILFPGSIPNELDGNLFGFMATIELCSLFFFRTRETLYYVPKITYIALLAFLLYVNFTTYGFYMKAFLVTNWFVLGVMFYCIGAFEIPMAGLRDQEFCKPTVHRPRVLFQPLFSITWYHDLPPLWSIFIPLYDRSAFTPQEMSLLDRNHHMLNVHLNNRPADPLEEQPLQEDNPQPQDPIPVPVFPQPVPMEI